MLTIQSKVFRVLVKFIINIKESIKYLKMEKEYGVANVTLPFAEIKFSMWNWEVPTFLCDLNLYLKYG